MDTALNNSFGLKGEFKVITTCSKTGKVLRDTGWQPNQIVANSARGVYILLDLLAGITTYTGAITHMALGDSATAASSSDTALGNELERVAVLGASTVRSANQVTYKAFFPDVTTANDTYTEVGTFIDGTATLGSGRLWSRIIFGTPLVKAAGEDNTIVYRVTATV
jgi:hypothetical protein